MRATATLRRPRECLSTPTSSREHVDRSRAATDTFRCLRASREHLPMFTSTERTPFDAHPIPHVRDPLAKTASAHRGGDAPFGARVVVGCVLFRGTVRSPFGDLSRARYRSSFEARSRGTGDGSSFENPRPPHGGRTQSRVLSPCGESSRSRTIFFWKTAPDRAGADPLSRSASGLTGPDPLSRTASGSGCGPLSRNASGSDDFDPLLRIDVRSSQLCPLSRTFAAHLAGPVVRDLLAKTASTSASFSLRRPPLPQL
jgi:hypothetical protein